LPIELEPVGHLPSVDVGPDGVRAAPNAPKAFAPPVEVNVGGPPKTRSLPDSVRERLAALKAGPPPKSAPASAAAPAESPAEPAKPADGTSTSPAVEVVPANDEKTPEPAPEWHAERDELQGVAQRQRDIIARLQSELEAAKKGADETMSARAKRIEEAESSYVRDPVAAIRSLVAAANGFEPGSKEHEEELQNLFIDLTSAVTGATQDPAHQAKRVSDLTRREWDRTTKRREQGEKKQAETAAPSEQGNQTETAIPIVKAAFAPIADKYPHLSALAHELDGMPVERVLWDVIEKGLKSGDFKPDEADDALTAKAAKLAEQHYQRRWQKIQSAAPKPSTAQPGVPPAPKQADTPAAEPAKTVERQSNGRGLSNADASVAPSKTPQEEQPKKMTDAERKKWALRHFNKG
jgi:hypothetical protein